MPLKERVVEALTPAVEFFASASLEQPMMISTLKIKYNNFIY
ncbi:hypothetical protein J709_0262 [Acinetobacter baumannii 7893]|nr:hypothetical protein ACINNAV2_3004 [Acinetobacter baumannii Naval-2]EXC66091.1 hypothetical protein J453_2627 [Acinetobacter baumannii 1036938]EXD21308.1 hypothetical protein J480_4062 [Acinetobacter baumannii 34654]EXE41862.1 hypothetical protein J574_2174 [Acinetobacter baumannii 1526966]EXG71294.1 hypothetical protein J709_0262 [Acinetobacter baumannii 7893]EXH37397.1 hypothetical protein J629_2594 [Acinetobacter baumannii 1207552]